MNQMTQQTETRDIRLENNTAKRIVSVVFVVIEIILGLRFVFKLLGANPGNGFVKAIYNSTQFFVGIFEGIFARSTINAAQDAVFEPETLIAIVLVALAGWVVLKLMTPRTSNRVERTEYLRPVMTDNQQNPVVNRQDPNQQNPVVNQQDPSQQNPVVNQHNPRQQNPVVNQQDPNQQNPVVNQQDPNQQNPNQQNRI